MRTTSLSAGKSGVGSGFCFLSECTGGASPLRRSPPPARQERPRFVFAQPKLDIEAPKAPKRSEDSDKNRIAASQTARSPMTNPLPYARGNSAERAEATPEERS